MMTKEDLRAELGDYINRFHKRRDYMGLEGALGELHQDLDDLFDGADAPTALFYAVELRADGRFQLEVDSFEAAADKEEWLACFQDYVGDRFVVEPYQPEPVQFNISVDASESVDRLTRLRIALDALTPHGTLLFAGTLPSTMSVFPPSPFTPGDNND